MAYQCSDTTHIWANLIAAHTGLSMMTMCATFNFGLIGHLDAAWTRNLFIQIATDNMILSAVSQGWQRTGILSPLSFAAFVYNGALSGTNRLLLYSQTGKHATLDAGGSLPAGGVTLAPTTNFTVGNGNQISAEVATWSATLTDDEIASLAKGFSPRRIRPQSLVFYAPLIRNLQDVRKGLALTPVNSPTVAAHPRVYA